VSGEGAVFKDHFSGHAGDYAVHRPGYPPELFAWLAEQAPDRDVAWDCATGNGQAAIALTKYFDQVVASDASTEQIGHAAVHPQVTYRVEPAEASAFAAESISLVTAAQAYHWFDHSAFHREAGRVLKPAGILAIWTYPLARIDDRVDALVLDIYDRQLEGYWPREREYVDRAYRDFTLPWPELEPPDFEMTAKWTLPALLGYLGTWSGMKRFEADRGFSPLEAMRDAFESDWGDPDEVKTVRWPVILRVCRKA
jgi:SAM-dependent methyltransferase